MKSSVIPDHKIKLSVNSNIFQNFFFSIDFLFLFVFCLFLLQISSIIKFTSICVCVIFSRELRQSTQTDFKWNFSHQILCHQ